MPNPTTTLTFDVDDVEEMDDFIRFVEGILDRFGENVWIRKSSSGEGYHLKVVEGTEYDVATGKIVFKEKHMDVNEVLKIREETDGECRGRLKGDTARVGAGMSVGRLFFVKSNKVCGSWIPANAFLNNPNCI